MIKWLCEKDKFLLGYVEGSLVRIKRKDLYVTVEGGKVTVICRRCGTPNTIEDIKERPKEVLI